MGVGKFVGVTSISIAIAHYLRSLKASVAILELNRENHFSCLEKSLGISDGNHMAFHYKGVDYYKEVGPEELLKILSMKYDYFVFDVGARRNAVKELIRADCKIVVGLECEWRMGEVDEFCTTYENEEWIKQVNLIFNMASEIKQKRSKIIKCDCLCIDYIKDKYKVKPEIRQIFRRLISLS